MKIATPEGLKKRRLPSYRDYDAPKVLKKNEQAHQLNQLIQEVETQSKARKVLTMYFLNFVYDKEKVDK